MYFKLSLRNVRKSFSNYTLYFLTLTFGVCVFYVFNSIESQKAMMQISDSVLDIMKTITWLMNGVSVFVSFILGFLIVYANNFLIRRRKREFGIYMSLGMEKYKISTILIAETFIIGVFSLIAGLIGGIFLSQGLSVITAKLFEVNMTGYTFIFSVRALWKTVLYFGIIFLIAIIAGTINISRYKLIDLINSEKQNERQRVKKPFTTAVLFIFSVILIGSAYVMVLKYGIITFDRKTIIECVLGAAGTFLFFAALSGFLLRIIQANKKFYLKGLNMFIMRQINSRVNTAHISMSLICLMLFVTICIFSTGIGMTGVLNKGYADAAPFDVSLEATGGSNIAETLKDKGMDLEEYADSSYSYQVYDYKEKPLTDGMVFKTVEDMLPADKLNDLKKTLYTMPLHYITVSDYNKIMKLQNKKGIDLPDGNVALLTQYAWADADYSDILSAYVKKDSTLSIGSTVYPVYPRLLSAGISNAGTDILTLVVPDRLAKSGLASKSVTCFNCKGDSFVTQDRFERDITNAQKGLDDSAKILTVSKNEIRAQEGGSKAIISFVAIYVGIVFLITSAAVLALQQLSEAADNRHRYTILRKIGADNKLLRQTVFKQIAIYFLLPLILACIHSVVGIKVANDAIREVGSLNAVSNILMTAAIILIVYGAYFIATYMGSKNIILKGDMRSE